MNHAETVSTLDAALGVKLPLQAPGAEALEVRTPIDGSPLARLPIADAAAIDAAVARAHAAFPDWRDWCAPTPWSGSRRRRRR